MTITWSATGTLIDLPQNHSCLFPYNRRAAGEFVTIFSSETPVTFKLKHKLFFSLFTFAKSLDVHFHIKFTHLRDKMFGTSNTGKVYIG